MGVVARSKNFQRQIQRGLFALFRIPLLQLDDHLQEQEGGPKKVKKRLSEAKTMDEQIYKKGTHPVPSVCLSLCLLPCLALSLCLDTVHKTARRRQDDSHTNHSEVVSYRNRMVVDADFVTETDKVVGSALVARRQREEHRVFRHSCL